MSLETDIINTQNMLNGKQARIGSLVIDNLTVNNPININKLNINKLNVNNLEVKNLNVTGKLTTSSLKVTGGASFSSNVVINGGITVGGNSSFGGTTHIPNISIGALRNVTIQGWLKVETSITAGGEIRGSRVWNAVWN